MLKQIKWLGQRPWLLSGLLWLACLTPAQAAVEMRIAISKGVSAVQVGSSTNAIVKNKQGQAVGEIAAMSSFSVAQRGGSLALDRWKSDELWIEPENGGYVWIGDRWYRGRVRLLEARSGVTAINHVDLEDYLYSVVGAEAIPSWPLEALKAQAVAARTYALNKRIEGQSKTYDMDTTTENQVYKGLNTEYSTTHAAVDGTTSQVMTYDGKMILAVFHSSSGGHTENVEDVWTQRLPYLRGVTDYDQSAPVFQWNKTIAASQLGSQIGVGTVTQMVPQRQTPQGRVISMRVTGTAGTKVVSGDRLRTMLDLRSTLFSATPKDGTIYIYGRGFGHGVGLSQWGAYGLAEQGVTYQQILDHYYQNSVLAVANTNR